MEKWKDKLFERFSISHEELDWLLFNATEVSFGPNTTIVDEQEIDTHLYILVEGVWRAYTYREGKEATIWFASSGDFVFSVWGYIMGQPSLLRIESITESRGYSIRKDVLERLFATSLAFANLGRKLVEGLVVYYEMWGLDMWRQRAAERYLALMNDMPEAVRMIPLKYIASYLGITVQSLSRIRSEIVKR